MTQEHQWPCPGVADECNHHPGVWTEDRRSGLVKSLWMGPGCVPSWPSFLPGACWIVQRRAEAEVMQGGTAAAGGRENADIN